MHLRTNKDYIDLKEQLHYSDFQMYIFLRVYELITAYDSTTLQAARLEIRKYLMDMDWHNAFIEHVHNNNKLVWQDYILCSLLYSFKNFTYVLSL